jgi:hypothetical protein
MEIGALFVLATGRACGCDDSDAKFETLARGSDRDLSPHYQPPPQVPHLVSA